MILYPSESLILGLFILTAIFFIIAAALQISNLFADNGLQPAIHKLCAYNNWIARIFLFLALAAGVASSLMPVDGCMQ